MTHCGNYSQSMTDRGHHVSQHFVWSVFRVVIYSYIEQVNVIISFYNTACVGVSINPCGTKIHQDSQRKNAVIYQVHMSNKRTHYIINFELLDHCDNIMKSKTTFVRFEVKDDACVSLQISTPPWHYNTAFGSLSFQYHCKLVLLQDHYSTKTNTLHYLIKLYQHETSMVLPEEFKTKPDQSKFCLFHHLFRLPFRKEMTGYGDMMSFLFKKGNMISEAHIVHNNWCANKQKYKSTARNRITCDKKVISKSYNSSVVSFYDIIEAQRKLHIDSNSWFIDDTGTFSMRLVVWGHSWISIQVQKSQYYQKQGNTAIPVEMRMTMTPTRCNTIPPEQNNSVLQLMLGPGTFLEEESFGQFQVNVFASKWCYIKPYLAYTVSVTLREAFFSSGELEFFSPTDKQAFALTVNYSSAANRTIYLGFRNIDPGSAFDFFLTKTYRREYCEPVTYDGFHLRETYIFVPLVNMIDYLQVKSKHILLFSVTFEGNTPKSYLNPRKPFSWKQAQERCRDANAFLLKVYSLNDLKKFVRLYLNLVNEVRFPLLSFYYGIHRQVSKFFIGFVWIASLPSCILIDLVIAFQWNSDHLIHDDNTTLGYQPWLRHYGQSISPIFTAFPVDVSLQPWMDDMALEKRDMEHFENLKAASLKASVVWQPQKDKQKRCSLLQLNDLLHPQIIMADCHRKLSNHRVICRQNPSDIQTHANYSHKKQCPRGTIQTHEFCFSTHFKGGKGFQKSCCTDIFHVDQLLSNTIFSLVPLLETMTVLQGHNVTYVSPEDKNGRICHVANNIYSASYLSKSLNWLVTKTLCNSVTGLFLCALVPKENNLSHLVNIFQCEDSTFISSLLLCDEAAHCNDGKDEDFCSMSEGNLMATRCHMLRGKHSASIGQCLLWTNKRGILQPYQKPHFSQTATSISERWTFEELYSNRKHQEADAVSVFGCRDSQTIPSSLVNNTIPDCVHGDDEWYISLLSPEKTCPDPTMLPCIPGHPRCFNRSDLCLNRRHAVLGHLEPCPNGAHLAECELFMCNQNFKCPGYYCVHISNLCDGTVDCPHGEDELNCSDHTCANKFSCTYTHRCIHLFEICDGIGHCEKEEDEVACELKPYSNRCQWLNYAIHCYELKETNSGFLFDTILPHIYVSLNKLQLHVSSTLTSRHLSHFPNCLAIHINMNNISSVCANVFQNSYRIIHLNLNNNSISEISKECFGRLPHMIELNLKHNKLNLISENAFKGLHKLAVLDLSFNHLKSFLKISFRFLPKLYFLIIVGNPITSFDATSFSTLFPALKNIETDDFVFCCQEQRPHVVCETMPPWPSSCSNIFETSFMIFLLLTMALVVFCFNTLSTVKHAVQIVQTKKALRRTPFAASLSESRNAYNFTTILINISDAMLGTYLLTISAVDISYHGSFFKVEKRWRSGITCHMLSFVYLCSCCLSVFSITFLAFVRNRLTVSPLKTALSKERPTKICLLIGTGLTVCLALSLHLSYWFAEGHISIPNSFCILIGNIGQSMTEKITSVFVSVVEFSAIVVILILYCHLVKSFIKQKQALAKFSSNTINFQRKASFKKGIVIQLFVLGVSNILCWVPQASFNCISLSVQNYPINSLIWVTVVALPLNGVINPVVFNYRAVKMLCLHIKQNLAHQM